MDDLPKIQELENTQEQLLSDLKEISTDCEDLRVENEDLVKKLNSQKNEMEEIIEVKDEQIMKLQEVNDECTRVRAELQEKEKIDQGHLQECFDELERLNALNQQLYSALEEKTEENDEMRDDIDKLKNGYEIYEKEKKKATKYKKELKLMKERDKENIHINNEREEAILKIKNSFMYKVEELQNEVHAMKQKQEEKSATYK